MDTESRVRELLGEVVETHHRVYRIVDGVDPDWASWYAHWLINLSEFPALAGTSPVPSELIFHLVRLDKEYSAAEPSEPWEEYYARELVAVFGSPARGAG